MYRGLDEMGCREVNMALHWCSPAYIPSDSPSPVFFFFLTPFSSTFVSLYTPASRKPRPQSRAILFIWKTINAAIRSCWLLAQTKQMSRDLFYICPMHWLEPLTLVIWTPGAIMLCADLAFPQPNALAHTVWACLLFWFCLCFHVGLVLSLHLEFSVAILQELRTWCRSSPNYLGRDDTSQLITANTIHLHLHN